MDSRSSEIIAAQKDDALRMLQAARMYLLEKLPFYGTLLSGLQFVENHTWCSTMATDHKRIYYSPEFIMGLADERKTILKASLTDKQFEMAEVFYSPKSVKEVAFLLSHEVGHIICDHLVRGKSFEPELFNIACDHVINTGLVVDFSKPPCVFFPKGKSTEFVKGKPFGFLANCYCDMKFHGWIAENVYAVLDKQRDQNGGKSKNGKGENSQGDKRQTDDHMSGNGGTSDDLGKAMGYDQPQPVISQSDKDQAMQDSGDMLEAAMQASGGRCPEAVREFVKNRGKPVINYIDIIKQRMLSKRKAELTYRKPGRRSGSLTATMRKVGAINKNQHVIVPGRNPENTIDIVVALDVSGSISQRTLKKMFNEITGLCNLYKEFKVTMFCWSTEVGEVKVYTRGNIDEMINYEVHSTWGTTAACVFEYLDANIPNAKDVIVLTDLYFEHNFEQKAVDNKWKKYDTLWVLTEGYNKNYIPSFGKTVELIEYAK